MDCCQKMVGFALGCGLAVSGAHAQVQSDIDGSALPALSHVAPGGGAMNTSDGATQLRSGSVVLDAEMVRALPEMGGRVMEIGLFEDVRFRATFDRREDFGDGRYSWVGRHGADAGDWFVLSVVEGTVTATFWTSEGEIFEIMPRGEGDLYTARQLEGVGFQGCATCEGAELHQHDHKHAVDWSVPEPMIARNQQDDGSVIEVMVAYTPAARDAMGGTNGIESLVQSAITSTNAAYTNSEITTQLELVWVGLVNYQESSSASTDLSRLRGTTDGFMDDLHATRDTVQADMVALISNVAGFCGIGYIMFDLSPSFATSAFSVTDYACAVGNLTFAHELGHNQGSAHDRDNAGGALFSYSYGHRWTTTGGSLRRSVMAYAPGSRRPYFSNPDVLEGGAPTGVENSEDNARSINEAAFTIANFRVSTPPPPPPDAPGPFGLLTPIEGATDVDPNGFFSLTWEPSDRADGYVVSVARDAGMTDFAVGPLTRSSASLTVFPGTLDPGTQYYWSVVATNENPESTESTPSVGTFATLGFESPCDGDVNGDSTVDLADFNILGTNFGSGPGATYGQGDLTGDGFVDLADFNVLGTNFGSSCD